jgi:HSP20 family protein
MWSNNNKKKKSFFERITGSIRMKEKDDDFEDDEDLEDEDDSDSFPIKSKKVSVKGEFGKERNWEEDVEQEGQLSVDVYQTPSEIIVVSMVAGVRPEDLQINISRDMIVIRGKREENRTISDENFFTRELYWGTFSRTILLPQEVEPEEADATEKHGLLVIRLPKIDKGKKSTLRVKSI